MNSLVPSLDLRRRLVWDIVADEKIPAYAEALGITPASEDVDKANKVAAYARLALITPIGEPVTMLAALASDILTRSLFRDYGLEATDIDVERINLVLQSGCQAVIAELIDLGVLTYGPAVVGLDFG